MADARRKPNQAQKLLLGQGDPHGATGGSTSAPGAGDTVGPRWDMERSRRRFCPVPPALGAAFVCDSWLCASLAAAWAVQEQRETERGWAGGVSLLPAQLPLAVTPGSLCRVNVQPGCATRCAQQGCQCFSNPIRGMEKRFAGQLRPAWQDPHRSAYD